jgi:isopenicillin-N N-acyltransferase-like protein
MYRTIFRRYASLDLPDVRARARAFVPALDEFDPELLPEMEGIAEGAGVEPDDVLAINLRTEIMFGLNASGTSSGSRECTAVCATGPGRPTIAAQNWDWKPAARGTCVILACAPDQRPAFVTLVEAGLLAKAGVNEAGVAVMTNALTSNLDRGEPGVPYHAVLRRILTSPSFDDAVASVRDATRASSANYLIASGDGRVADLEVTPGGSDAVRAVDGVAHANHFLWPAPRPFKDVGRADGGGSLRRQSRAEQLMSRGVSRPDDITTILRDHVGRPDSICAHRDPATDEVEDYVTVASVVIDVQDRTMLVTEGNPCEADFDLVDVAGHLTDARPRSFAPASGAG